MGTRGHIAPLRRYGYEVHAVVDGDDGGDDDGLVRLRNRALTSPSWTSPWSAFRLPLRALTGDFTGHRWPLVPHVP